MISSPSLVCLVCRQSSLLGMLGRRGVRRVAGTGGDIGVAATTAPPQPTIVPQKKRGKEVDDGLIAFVDSKRVRVKAGNGGDGAVSFLSEAMNEFAGPDGGDGGHGGHVLFRVSANISSLNHIPSVVKGEDGVPGQNKDMTGKAAEHTVVSVPPGTVVRSAGVKGGKLLVDLEEEGMIFIAARGGAGGRGNHFFTTDTNQAPRVAEKGGTGEEMIYQLDMKSMAHVGLIGFPNAGKSTLLRAMSRARPKVAPYPFTTLRPHVGVVKFTDFSQLSIADLPGLIPGAHENRGLGIAFLKHIERCSVLVYLIDLSSTLPPPLEQYQVLRSEVGKYKSELLSRPSVVVGNKIDVEGTDEVLDEFRDQIDEPIQPVSAKDGTHVPDVIYLLRNLHEQYTNSVTDDVKASAS